MPELTCTHHHRGANDRRAYEYEFTLGNAQRITFYHRPHHGWAPMTWRNEVIPPAQVAGMAGLDEAQAAAEIAAAAAAMCEAEFIKATGPALRAVA